MSELKDHADEPRGPLPALLERRLVQLWLVALILLAIVLYRVTSRQ